MTDNSYSGYAGYGAPVKDSMELRRRIILAMMQKGQLAKTTGEGIGKIGEAAGTALMLQGLREEERQRARAAAVEAGAAPPPIDRAAVAPIAAPASPAPRPAIAPAPTPQAITARPIVPPQPAQPPAAAPMPPQATSPLATAPAPLSQPPPVPPPTMRPGENAARDSLTSRLLARERLLGDQPSPAVEPDVGDYSFDERFPQQSGFSSASDEPAPTPPSQPADRAEVPLPPRRPVYDRSSMNAELEANPELKARLLTIARGEVGDDPEAQQRILETIFNRTKARDSTLSQQTQMYAGPGSPGYYPRQTFGRGQAPEDVLAAVMRGSDVGGQALGFAPTGNASGDVARSGSASGYYGNAGRLGGETYVTHRPDNLVRLEASRVPGAPLDIQPAPVQVAALGGGQPSPVLTGGLTGPPEAPEGNPPTTLPIRVAQTGIPGPLSPPILEKQAPQVGGRVDFPLQDTSIPDPPPPRPKSARETYGEQIYLRGVMLEDEAMQKRGLTYAAPDKAIREQQEARDVAAYNAKVDVWKKLEETRQAHALARPERERTAQKEEQALEEARQQRARFGGVSPAIVEDNIKKSAEVVKNVPAAAMSLANARRALNEGNMFTGLDADLQLTLAKAKAAAGFQPDPRIQPTEAFKSMILPMVAQARQAQSGGANISDNDMRLAERAAAGDIKLERGSINEVMSALERINTAMAVDHQNKVLTYTGNDPNAQRAMGGYFLPMERIVPEEAVRLLREHKDRPGVMQEFDNTFSTPGLAEKVLRLRR